MARSVTSKGTDCFDYAASGTTSWTNTDNLEVGGAGVSSNTLDFGGESHYLVASNFDAFYVIHRGARIKGVVCTIIGAANDATISSMVLYYDDLAGDEQASNQDLNGTTVFGSPTSLQGMALTPAIVNDDIFGFAIVAHDNEIGQAVQVSSMTMTIYYIPLGGFRTRERAFGRAR